MLLWLLSAAMIALGMSSCSSEKRVTRALLKLERYDLNNIRPWPYNYTYYEYTERLDEAKLRQEFYRKRELQARIAKDKTTVKTMQENIKRYQKKIDYLEEDKVFFDIYMLRYREIKIKLKKDQQAQKQITKQKLKIDRKSDKNRSTLEKKHKAQDKERQRQFNEKKALLAEKKKAHDQLIKMKERELKQVQRKVKKADSDEKVFYQDEIISILSELKLLKSGTK